MSHRKTVITVKEQPRPNHYVQVIDVKLTGKNEILVNMIKDTTALGKASCSATQVHLPPRDWLCAHSRSHGRPKRPHQGVLLACMVR